MLFVEALCFLFYLQAEKGELQGLELLGAELIELSRSYVSLSIPTHSCIKAFWLKLTKSRGYMQKRKQYLVKQSPVLNLWNCYRRLGCSWGLGLGRLLAAEKEVVRIHPVLLSSSSIFERVLIEENQQGLLSSLNDLVGVHVELNDWKA
jgi:hypothetical protein